MRRRRISGNLTGSLWSRPTGFWLLGLILLGASIAGAQDLETLDKPEERVFPNGFEIIDDDGNVIKTMSGSQKAVIQAWVDLNGTRIFMSDWSYERSLEGKSGYWIRPFPGNDSSAAAPPGKPEMLPEPEPAPQPEPRAPSPEAENRVAAGVAPEPQPAAEKKEGLVVLDKILEVEFPDGFQILRNEGGLIKEVDGPQKANVLAYHDKDGHRFYISDWGWERFVDAGIKPNWMVAISPSSPMPTGTPASIDLADNDTPEELPISNPYAGEPEPSAPAPMTEASPEAGAGLINPFTDVPSGEEAAPAPAGGDGEREILRLQREGRFVEALEAAKRAETSASTDEERARLLSLQSELGMALGNWREAEEVTRRLLKLRKDEGKALPGTEMATLTYGRILENLGRFPEALKFYDDGASRIERIPAGSASRAEEMVVSAFLRYGDFGRLEDFEQRRKTGFQLDPLEPESFSEGEGQAISVYRMARTAERKFDWEKAGRGYALYLEEAGFEKARYFHAIRFLTNQGLEKNAQDALRRYVSLAGTKPEILSALDEWGKAMVAAGMTKEARSLLGSLEKKTAVMDRAPVALARTYDLIGAESDAKRVCRESLPRLEKLAVEHPERFRTPDDQDRHVEEMVEAYLAVGDLNGAMDFLKRRYGDIGNPDGTLAPPVKNAIYAASLFSGDPRLMFQAARNVTRDHREQMERIVTKYPEDERLSSFAELSPLNYPFSLSDPKLAADAVLKFKVVVLDSLARERRLSNELTLDPGKNRKREGLEILRSLYLRDELRGTPGLLFKVLDARISALEDEIYGKSAARDRLVDVESVSWESVSEALGPQDALVEFVRYGRMAGLNRKTDQYAAVVVRRDGLPRLLQLGAADSIDEEILELRSLIDRIGGGASSSTSLDTSVTLASQTLYGRVWAPLETSLDGANRVFVSADGLLREAPLASLMDSNRIYATRKWRIRQLGSGRDLLRKAERGGSKTVVLLGNPDFASGADRSTPVGNSRSLHSLLLHQAGKARFQVKLPLSKLPGADTETSVLSHMLESADWKVSRLAGAEAREESLQFDKPPRILHLGTHGIFQRDGAGVANPMVQSFVALAGADVTLGEWKENRFPNPIGDGILLAAEAASLNLSGTDLVVLSACESELGDGDWGVMGLKRALQLAGARNVATTLWEIRGQETTGFMQLFYRKLISGDDPGDALADTQALLLEKLLRDKGAAEAMYFAGPFVVDVTGN